MRLRWLTAALADLRAIKAYIAEENPQAANRVVDCIHAETNTLLKQPNIGRIGRIADTRTRHYSISLHRGLSRT